MNDLYRQELRLWLNLYLPSVKLLRKVRVGSKRRRVYDGPKTPFERVVASKQGDAAQLLKELQRSLDPFQLAKIIDRKLERIYRLANRRLSPKAQEQLASSQAQSGRRKAVEKTLASRAWKSLRDSHFYPSSFASLSPSMRVK